MNITPNYNNTTASDGSYERIPAGGYVCKILKAWVETTRNGSEKICLGLEIAEGEYAGFAKRLFNIRKASNANATWPCLFDQFTLDKDGNTNPYFKGIIKAVEDSNAGYAWNWQEQTLANKLVGMIFREEEYLANDGTTKTTVRPAFVRSVERIRNGVDVPEIKRLNNSPANKNALENAGFTPVVDDKLPF